MSITYLVGRVLRVLSPQDVTAETDAQRERRERVERTEADLWRPIIAEQLSREEAGRRAAFMASNEYREYQAYKAVTGYPPSSSSAIGFSFAKKRSEYGVDSRDLP